MIKNRKVAIISELALYNVNYGNRLQAFALNRYLSNNFRCTHVDSLILSNFRRREQNKYTSINKALFRKIINKVIRKLRNNDRDDEAKSIKLFDRRIEKFDDFLEKNPEFSVRVINYDELINSDYDTFIVGSDVVWAQVSNRVNRIKFLDFRTQKEFKRISYAASFSRNYFPKENRKYAKRCLEKFDAISVRERFSVSLLEEIGIKAELVCDPTLLLSREEWEKIAVAPNIREKYVFVYLLGRNKECRERIVGLAKELNLKIVTVPYADGVCDGEDDFGDYKLSDCGPEEWIGLIENAEYVLTDSFHGLMFSTIFEKRFLVIKKEEVGKSADEHPPARMIDFLETIGEMDKYIPVPDAEGLNKIAWDYKEINKRVDAFRKQSIEYLENNLL